MSSVSSVCGRVQCEQCVWACVGVSSVSGAGGACVNLDYRFWIRSHVWIPVHHLNCRQTVTTCSYNGIVRITLGPD